ncbi:hypothetical protein NC653_011204 [Populus alba x Populus x berolinensis]|uniref:Uncharacterized protein n=1 Tax=Populus alba x Populus x berolinensis TaxID=444605 RepID=A0AAD6W635_9ROSI|nr:hypothetical protein NC653_011204 [Populus alba x Populus x berolinensis]
MDCLGYQSNFNKDDWFASNHPSSKNGWKSCSLYFSDNELRKQSSLASMSDV